MEETDSLPAFLANLDQHLYKIGRRRPWLADRSGVSLSTINGWYAHNRLPRLDDAKRVVDALGLTLEYLITGESLYEKRHPIIEEICENLERFSRDELLEARSVFQTWMIMNARRLAQDSRLPHQS